MKVFVCLVLMASVAFAEPPSNRQNRYFFARQQEAEAAPYQASGWRPDGPAFNLPQRAQKQQQQPPQQQYGAPEQQPQQGYGPPSQPQQQYGPPAQQPQQQYGAPAPQPQQQYGAPAPQQPQQGYGAPEGQDPRQGFRNQQFGRQQQQLPNQGYAEHQQNQGQYGPPQQPQQPQGQYGPSAQRPQTQYGPATDYPVTDVPNATEIDEPVTVGELKEREQTENANEFEEDADIDEPRAANNKPSTISEPERGEYYVALPDGRLQRVRYVSRQDLEAMRYFAKIRAENVEPLRGPIYAYAPLQKLQVAPGQLQVAVEPVAQLARPGRLTITAEAKGQKLIAPQVDIKPLAQVQVQQAGNRVVPLSSSYTTVTQNFGAAAPVEDRYIIAFP